MLVDTRQAVGPTFSDDLRRAVFQRFPDAGGWGRLRQLQHFPELTDESADVWRLAHGSLHRIWRERAQQEFIDSAAKVVPQVQRES